MPSGRKGRGSRRRSHKQHQKQKPEELSDYDQGSNLSHGPLPDSIPSPWTIEPLPPRVEGPPVLKQDAETVESLPGGINRKEAPQKALRVQIPARSKRKKGSTAGVTADSGATNSATALDRWDCGDLQADETLAYFYPNRVELEAAAFELKSSNDKVEVLANGTGNKDLKGDGNMKKRKWKSRPEVAAGNRSSTVIDALGPGQQVEASSHNVSMHTKHNATHQRGLSELEECNETDKSTLDVGMNAAKEQELGSCAFEVETLNSLRGGSLKRGEKGPESSAAAQLSHTFKTDVHKVESEWKGGKANDSGLSSSPKLPVLKLKRSEGSQKSQRSEDSVQIVGRDDAEVLEKLQYAAGKGTNWILTEDNRNPALEKELENRIRRRRGESREKEKWREDEKEKDIRRHHHQIEERHKDETRRRENEEEKPKEDGVEAEKDRSDSRQKDEKYKENRYMESKLNEEKQKTDRNRELPCRDDKECDENRNADKDKEERSIDRKLRGERDKVEKKRDNRQKEDAKWKDNFRDDRCRVDKDKEGRLKDEKVPDYRHKEQRLKDERQRSEDRFECHKEENSWGGRLQDEKEKQVRQRDKVDRPKDRDKEESLETIKEEKLRDEGGKNPSREDLKDEKGSQGKKKGQKEQEDTTRPDKLHGKRHKTDKRQDMVGRERVDSKRRGDRERESRQKEAIAKDEKQQAYKDGNESQRIDYRPMDDRVKPEKVEDDRNRDYRQRDERVDRGEKSKGEKVDVDRLIDSREKTEREKGDLERLAADVNIPGDKEDNQPEVCRKSSERFDGRKEDEKQGDGWQTKDSGLFDMDRDFHLSRDKPGIQSKDLADPVLARKTHDREIRRDREVVEKHTVQEGDRRGAKTSRDDAKDQERAFSLLSNSGASVPHKPERQLKRTRNFGTVDSVITEKIHERSRSKRAGAENDLPLDDNKVLHCTQEDTLSTYDCSPQSPSPSLPSGSLPPSSEKPARRTKFETSISVSSSNGTRQVKERSRHIIEQTDRIKQHRALEEEVKSWDLRGTNQDSDDGRGWSLSPDKNWDAFSSLPLDSAKDEYSRGPMRGHEDGYVPEQEHHKFPQGGGLSKARQAWLHQSSQINRAPMGGPMVRPQVQTRLLPPPPPFRPGIDNPAVIGSYSSSFDEGLGSRESGRYDRKSGGAFKRSEMGGPGETWRGVGVVMGMGMGNWNAHAQNPGPGPGPANMFAPSAQIGGHPSVGYLGMAQQFPVSPLYVPGSARPPADMGFGDGTRYHVGDARVCFPQGPNHGPVMGRQRPAEPDEKSPPLVDMWGGQGHYTGERHRFGYLEWGQADGMTGRWERGPDLWQGQAGDVSTGFNLPRFQREASCQGSVAGEASTFCEDNDQKNEDPLQEIPDTADPQKVSPADPADVVISVVPQAELKSTVRSRARLTRISLNLDVSDKLVSNDLYKQYLSLLPASKAKERETWVLQCDGSHGPMEEDLEFEVDLEAQKLLSTLVPYADLLPQLSNNAFKEALAVYHRPIQDTCVQKSVFGSFILPVYSSLIKMPSLGVDLDTVRVGQLEASGDQPCSSNAFDSPLSAGNESLIGASRLMEDTLQEETEQVQDNQGLSLVQAEFSMGRCVEIVPRGNQQGVAEVSFKQGAHGGTVLCRDEDIAINVDLPAHQLASAVVVNCNIGLDISVVEANVELSAEIQTGEDDNTRQMEVVQLDCKGGGEWPTRRDLVEHCSKCFQQGGREQHTEVAQSLEEEDGVDSARQTTVRTEERQRVLKPEFKRDEIKINCRPQKSSEIGCENTH